MQRIYIIQAPVNARYPPNHFKIEGQQKYCLRQHLVPRRTYVSGVIPSHAIFSYAIPSSAIPSQMIPSQTMPSGMIPG